MQHVHWIRPAGTHYDAIVLGACGLAIAGNHRAIEVSTDIVVGADEARSTVAAKVRAQTYAEGPTAHRRDLRLFPKFGELRLSLAFRAWLDGGRDSDE